jgi:hypothetical protein
MPGKDLFAWLNTVYCNTKNILQYKKCLLLRIPIFTSELFCTCLVLSAVCMRIVLQLINVALVLCVLLHLLCPLFCYL